LTDQTLVVFSSDNGPARAGRGTRLESMYDSATGKGFNIAASRGITGGRKGYKAALFEGGVGVPFIARWPGRIAAGKVDKTSIFSAVDLLPTFCEIAGVKLPASYQPDGVSQVGTLKGKGRSLRGKPLFWKMVAPWPARKAKPDHWVSYAVVHQNWKLVSSRDGDYVELYDLVADPLEKKDLKGKHPEVIKELEKMLEKWQATLPAKPTGSVFSNLRSGKK
ncbi:MAG: sulfatase-like hydrolase/transferase, partial [Planctomycetes bacterium]|nr:sulfatase-like hydrolase/transferase [Planctomycetota bacterium]